MGQRKVTKTFLIGACPIHGNTTVNDEYDTIAIDIMGLPRELKCCELMQQKPFYYG